MAQASVLSLKSAASFVFFNGRLRDELLNETLFPRALA
jgi:hypothetical protein